MTAPLAGSTNGWMPGLTRLRSPFYVGSMDQRRWDHRGGQCGRYRLGSGQIADDDFGAECPDLRGTIVLTTDHDPHGYLLSAQVLEDLTTHAASTGDENKVAGNHQLISFGETERLC